MAASEAMRTLTPIDTKVAEVTLLEDRAHVTRMGTLTTRAGRMHVSVEGVSPVMADKTLAAKVVNGGARVVNARVVRRDVIQPSAADVAGGTVSDLGALQIELDELNDDIAGHKVKYELLRQQGKSLDRIAALTYAELAEDVTWGGAIADAWANRLSELSSRERALVSELVTMTIESQRLNRKRDRLRTRISAQHGREHCELALVELELVVDEPGDCQLRLDYLVPNACWRPYHTARLGEAGDAALTFETDACVWQNTGEDWADCQLVFSTERPSLGTTPPELTSDVLRVTRKSESVVVAAREQEITTTGLGADDTAASPELPGIDDGGEPLTLRGLTRSSVPSDGRPYRVPLASFDSPADVDLVAFPELSRCVVTKSTQSNRGAGPILAGPVDLVRNSGFVGRTSVLFIAAGEKFDLGWGPVADLRIARDEETQAEKSRMLSSWVSRRHKVEVRISNLAGRPFSIQVKERVPVSEIDKVKIELQKDVTTGQKTPDEHGFVTWDVDLASYGHHTLELGYIFKKHEDVAEI